MSYNTPTFIKCLLKPNASKPAGRRVWGIDLESVLLPFFTATNCRNETRIPHEAMGAPLRLAYNPDGTVRFSKAGRPVVKVVKEIGDEVKLMRENYIANLLLHAHNTAENDPDGYKAEAMANQEAGRPIVERDNQALVEAVAEAEAAVAEAVAEAEKVPVPA